ncbi:MAG: hypothetical protein ACRDCD_01230 [Mycoplasmoidaceae bacterium]
MKKSNFDGKPILVITINGEPLLDIHPEQKKKFYNYLILLSIRYKLILVTDMPQSKSKTLNKEIGLTDGFIINNCGSAVFDIKRNEIISVDNMKKSKILPIYRQALIAGDSVIFHTQNTIYIYTHYVKLLYYFVKSFKGTKVELIQNYDDGIKNLMRNKVEALEIYNTFYDVSTIFNRNEKIHSICENENLVYNELNSSRLLIIESCINNAINLIMEKVNMHFTEVYLINLTNIFHNQNISSSYEYQTNTTMEDLFENKTFQIFDSELKNIIVDNNFLSIEEIELYE